MRAPEWNGTSAWLMRHIRRRTVGNLALRTSGTRRRRKRGSGNTHTTTGRQAIVNGTIHKIWNQEPRQIGLADRLLGTGLHELEAEIRRSFPASARTATYTILRGLT